MQTNHRRTLFNAKTDGQSIAPKSVPPESKQEPLESQRLWKELTRAIVDQNMEAATDAKSTVEDAQREKARLMEERGKKYVPRFFEEARDGRWVPKLKYVIFFKFVCSLRNPGWRRIPTDPKEANEVVRKWIFESPPPAQQ